MTSRNVGSRLVLLACGALGALGCGGVGPKVEDYKQYTVTTSFNVQSDFEEDSSVGKVLNLLRDFGDEPQDPGKFVVERVIDYLPTPLDAAASPLSGELGGLVNQSLYAAIPDIVDEVKGFGQGVANTVRVFEVESVLDVGLDAQGRYTASHQLKKVTFGFRDVRLVLEGAELGPVAVPDCIPVEIDDGVLTVEEHELPLPVGSIVSKGINRLVIPAVAGACGGCVSYVDLIATWLQCAAIAGEIAEKIDTVDSTPLVLAACTQASNELSGKLTEMIADLDRNGGFKLKGGASISADGSTVTGGTWSGEYRLTEKVKAKLESGSAAFVAQELGKAL